MVLNRWCTQTSKGDGAKNMYRYLLEVNRGLK